MVVRLRTVLVALVSAGALLGALCGLVAIAPLGLQQWLRPTPDDGFVSLADLAPAFAVIGAVLGAALVPALAFGMLRTIALWRVCAALLFGAVSGTLAVWAAEFTDARLCGPGAFAVAAGLGALAAALWLRRHTLQVRETDA